MRGEDNVQVDLSSSVKKLMINEMKEATSRICSVRSSSVSLSSAINAKNITTTIAFNLCRFTNWCPRIWLICPKHFPSLRNLTRRNPLLDVNSQSIYNPLFACRKSLNPTRHRLVYLPFPRYSQPRPRTSGFKLDWKCSSFRTCWLSTYCPLLRRMKLIG